ncbi:LVIVD repeat-containing protein [Streptomyces sp. KR80]|uniref:LVIVD repeat-containing protein n=1 Tax=Streptomyces sp. KR80 TaxID=3457426 RepID=UPI003FCFBC32
MPGPRLCGRPVHALVAGLLAVAAALWAAGPAVAHDGDDDARWKDKRKQYTAGVSVPLVSTPNVHLVTNLPDTAAISGCFAKTAPYFYVSSLDSVSVFDVSKPLAPKLTGVLDNLVFENEAVNCGEKEEDGVTRRFVLVGIDLTQASSDDIAHVRPVGFDELMVVDVTDPAKPSIRSRTKTSSSTHTVACVRDTACQYAYTAGGDGKVSIVDLRDLDAPKELKTFSSPVLGWAGHKWNFDNAGYGIHTAAGGTAIFDVRDPVNPKLVTTTGPEGTAPGWNDFIHHNSDRPNAAQFTPGAAPAVGNGNVLLVTEEDYENTDCATAGSFQTWHVQKLDGTPDAIRPLDRINPVDAGEGVALPHEAFCSAHWFDHHPSGIVAQGYYQGGLRLIDVRDPENLTEYGYFASGLSEVWDAYWVPERTANGVATGHKTNIVYTADLIRGLDVFTVDLPASGRTTAAVPLLPAGAGQDAAGSWPEVAVTVGPVLAALIALIVYGRRRASRGTGTAES